MLEPVDLLGEALDGALLHVRVRPSVDGLSARRLLEETDDCRWAAQVSLVALVGGWRQCPSTVDIARGNGFWVSRKWLFADFN
jgi:hypothetical protein